MIKLNNCDRCKDTGEIEKTIHGISNVETGESYITYTGFCLCDLGQQKARIWNNGITNK